MDLRTKSVDELIEVALTTSCVKTIEFLVGYPAMIVRRALAKNSNTPVNVLNMLAVDPVLNVSYIAASNPRSSVNREFDCLPTCVTCTVDERKLNCTDCNTKKAHKF